MLRITDNGNSEYVIIIRKNHSASEKTAAEELAAYLKKITDAEIPVKTDDEKKTDHEIVIGFTNRGGKGVKTINITEKTGKLISIQAVTDDNDLMIINRSGLTIRTAVSQIRVAGRATQGVRIINLREGDAIASVMAVPGSEEEELAAVEGGENPAPAATDETPAAEQ